MRIGAFVMILAACAMFGCSSSNSVERDQILVPRVENVRIDGIEEEWGERGYRVEVFSDTAATLCGGWDAKDAVRLKHLPTWVFHGDNDTVVPLEESTKMVEGVKKVDGNVQFTIYPASVTTPGHPRSRTKLFGSGCSSKDEVV